MFSRMKNYSNIMRLTYFITWNNGVKFDYEYFEIGNRLLKKVNKDLPTQEKFSSEVTVHLLLWTDNIYGGLNKKSGKNIVPYVIFKGTQHIAYYILYHRLLDPMLTCH